MKAFTFNEDSFDLKILDQKELPNKLVYKTIKTTQDGFNAIRDMFVRGAPCIAAVACLSIVTELNSELDATQKSSEYLIDWLVGRTEFLIASRPTAVNLKQALEKMIDFARARKKLTFVELRDELSKFCINALESGRIANRRLGEFGARELLGVCKSHKLSILTHCNTGALATVGHGTALGVIRSLQEFGNLQHAYCTETRPYFQGSRLTAFELVEEKIPATLIADDMVAFLMATHKIDAVVVGADRVVANGDTANKIGTLQIAVTARYYNVPFYVAAPTQSIDLKADNSNVIVIEERPDDELKMIRGIQLAPSEIRVWNPCFDITPTNLISGIITEHGVCRPDKLVTFMSQLQSSNLEDALF